MDNTDTDSNTQEGTRSDTETGIEARVLHWSAGFATVPITIHNADDYTSAQLAAIYSAISKAFTSEAFAKIAYPALHAIVARHLEPADQFARSETREDYGSEVTT